MRTRQDGAGRRINRHIGMFTRRHLPGGGMLHHTAQHCYDRTGRGATSSTRAAPCCIAAISNMVARQAAYSSIFLSCLSSFSPCRTPVYGVKKAPVTLSGITAAARACAAGTSPARTALTLWWMRAGGRHVVAPPWRRQTPGDRDGMVYRRLLPGTAALASWRERCCSRAAAVPVWFMNRLFPFTGSPALVADAADNRTILPHSNGTVPRSAQYYRQLAVLV